MYFSVDAEEYEALALDTVLVVVDTPSTFCPKSQMDGTIRMPLGTTLVMTRHNLSVPLRRRSVEDSPTITPKIPLCTTHRCVTLSHVETSLSVR